jgi:predicted  nucleic acid-binding Zn-ribbon protein
MNKYRQYRMMKKARKMLNTPVKEEVYTPSSNVYMTDKSLRTGDDNLDPNRGLRMTQVDAVARLLLQQISRLEVLYADGHKHINRESKQDIDATSTEIGILFEELDQGVLLTEGEKTIRRLEARKSDCMVSSAENQASIDLTALSNQVQAWQQENTRRKKRLNRLESSIRELSLNVNDVRCTQILRDRKVSVAALGSTIDMGLRTLKDVFKQVQVACETLETTI